MALALGKVTILLGAGIAGSVLAREGRMPSFSDIFADGFKMVWRIGQGNSTPASKSRNNSLADQVNILRQELQSMEPNAPVIIMQTNSSGTNKFGAVAVVVVVGCGYAWWKGWKLPDMMFATKRGLTDACLTVQKQLEDVYSGISTTRRALSTKIESVDSKIEECSTMNETTNVEVSQIQGRTSEIGNNIRNVRETVVSLGNKIGRIGARQNITNEGVSKLCDFAINLENRAIEQDQTPARPPRQAVVTRSQIKLVTSTSLPTSPLALEPASPSAPYDGSDQHQQPGQNAATPASDPIESIGILRVGGDSTPLRRIQENPNNVSSNTGITGQLFRRTLSVTQGIISRMQPS